MRNEFHLERRIQGDLIISEENYISGFFDITQWLIMDLETFMKDENRFFGIMPVYFERFKEYYSEFNKGCTETDCDIYGRIMYLFKPILIYEYKKLEQRRLSRADRVVVIMKRILDMIEDLPESQNHPKIDPIKQTNEIITKIYDRIRNNGKQLDLRFMINTMRSYFEKGIIGKICIDEFSIQSEISRQQINSKPITTENNIMMEENKGTVVWKG